MDSSTEQRQRRALDNSEVAGLAVLGVVLLVSLVVEIAAVVALGLLAAALAAVLVADYALINTQSPWRVRVVLVGLTLGSTVAGALAVVVDPVIAQLALVGVVAVATLRWTLDRRAGR